MVHLLVCVTDFQANSLVNSLIEENRIEDIGIAVFDEVRL